MDEGPILTTSQLFSGAHGTPSEFEIAKDVMEPAQLRLPRKISLPQLAFNEIIRECDDEEDSSGSELD